MISRVAVGELGIRRERKRLVPVRDGRDVVLELQVAAAASPPERLHGDREIGREPDGVGEVPAVEAEPLLRSVRAVGTQHLGHAGVRRRELRVLPADVEVVRAAEVVLGAGAADRRELVVAVDEELQLAFAPPAGVVHAPRAIRADVLAASAHAVEDPHDVAGADRVDATELRAEAAGVVGHVTERIRDLVVEKPFGLTLVGQRDACPPLERHLPVAVERAAGVHADRERRHLCELAPSAREEVADRALDRGLRIVVPVHAQDLVAPAARRRQPDVLDRARAFDVGEHERLVRRDHDRRRDLPPLSELARRARTRALGGHSAAALLAGGVLGADRSRLGVGETPHVGEPDAQSVPSRRRVVGAVRS